MNATTWIETKSRIKKAHVALCVTACAVGGLIPAFVAASEGKPERLLALPATIALMFLFAYSRTLLLILVIATRASSEIFFEMTRLDFGSIQIGVGGLINLFAILIAIVMICEKPKLFSREIVITWGPFLLVLFFETAISPYKASAIRIFLQLVSSIAIFVCAYFYVRDSSDRFKRCVTMVLVSSFIPVLIGLYQAVTHGGMVTVDTGLRVNSTFAHPNTFAFYLTLIAALMIYALESSSFKVNSFGRVALIGYLFLVIAALAVTKTRSAWLACFAIFFIYGIIYNRRYLIYLGVLIVLLSFIPELQSRVLEIVDGFQHPSLTSADRLNSFDWRLAIWKAGLSWMSRAHYLTGYGLESFFYYSSHFFPLQRVDGMQAHNVYVEMFFEFGLLGITAFLWAFYRMLRKFRLLSRQNRLAGFVVSILAIEYLMVAASDNMLGYLSFNWYIFFIWGAGMALALSTSEKKATVASTRPIGTVLTPAFTHGQKS